MEQITRNTYAETRSKCMTIPFGESYFVDRGANPCCIITEKGLIQVDATKNPMYASAWIESIRKISDKGYVIFPGSDPMPLT